MHRPAGSSERRRGHCGNWSRNRLNETAIQPDGKKVVEYNLVSNNCLFWKISKHPYWNEFSFMNSLRHAHLSLAIETSKEAGAILRDFFRKKVAVEAKAISDFVSEADLAAESHFVSTIKGELKDHRFLTEETHRDAIEAEHLWVIDPLDGTSNFLHGIPQFATSVAYYHNGIAELGVIYNPVSEDMFIAVKGQGAWWNQVQLHVSSELRLADTMVAVGFYYDRGKMMEATLQAISAFFKSDVHGVRRFGAAALDLAQLARGDYGVFMEYKLNPWDYAAGQLLVHEAGGIVTDCQNTPLDLAGPSSILATNGHLHPLALEIARQYLPN